MKINYDYAFAPPHTMTLCRPSASEKYLVEVMPSGLHIFWTRSTQKDSYPLAWTPHPIDIHLFLDLSVDGRLAPLNQWRRHASGAPYLFAEGEQAGVHFELSGIAGKTGVIFRVDLRNNDEAPRTCRIQLAHTNGWVISNAGWIDGVNNNLLMTMNEGRADRILAWAEGADEYAMYPVGTRQTEFTPPMNNESFGVAPIP